MKRRKLDFSLLGDESYAMILGTLRTSCVMLLCSLALLLEANPPGPDTYKIYHLAAQLESNALGIVVVGNFAALFLERLHRR